MSLKAYYSKHFEKRLQQKDHQPEQHEASVDNNEQAESSLIITSLPQTLTNKLKNKISFTSRDSSSSNNNSFNNSVNEVAADESTSPLPSDLNLSSNHSPVSYSIFKRSAKLKKLNSALSVDKRSRFDENYSSSSVSNHHHHTAAANTKSHSSSTSSNSVDLNTVIINTNMINSNSNNNNNNNNNNNSPVLFSSPSSAAAAPIVQQPQSVLMNDPTGHDDEANIDATATLDMSTSSSTSSNANSSVMQSLEAVASPMSMQSSPSFSSQSTPYCLDTTSSSAATTANHVSSPSSSSSSKTQTNNNNNDNTTSSSSSLSYLDEANLKMAIVDYPDIMRLVKLQNMIDYHEWLAFNSELIFNFF
jgi:hypothetical protein